MRDYHDHYDPLTDGSARYTRLRREMFDRVSIRVFAEAWGVSEEEARKWLREHSPKWRAQ